MEENKIPQNLKKAYELYSRYIKEEYEIPEYFLKIYRRDRELTENSELKNFIKKARSCCDKFLAVQYHYKNFVKKERKYVKNFKLFLKESEAENVTLAGLTSELNFEFEAFLFQFKSCLDIHSQAIGAILGQKPMDIDALIKTLSRDGADFSNKLIEIIQLNNGWLPDFASRENRKSQRDLVTHYESIKLGTLNVIKRKGKKFMVMPLKNCDIPARDYMKNRIGQLDKFLSDSYSLIFRSYFEALSIK